MLLSTYTFLVITVPDKGTWKCEARQTKRLKTDDYCIPSQMYVCMHKILLSIAIAWTLFTVHFNMLCLSK